MAYCGPRGIPLSEFLSWPEGDQDAALFWAARENRRHHGCGTHAEDWDTGPDDDSDPFHTQIRVCPGCRMLDIARAELQKQPEHTRYGAYVALIPGPEPFIEYDPDDA